MASPASSKWNVSFVSSVYLKVIISGHFFFDVILVIVESGLGIFKPSVSGKEVTF